MPITHDIVNLKGTLFFKLFLLEQVVEAFARFHEGTCDGRPKFEPQFGQHFILQNDKLGLVGKCAEHAFRIYIYGLLRAILHHKKVRQKCVFPTYLERT